VAIDLATPGQSSFLSPTFAAAPIIVVFVVVFVDGRQQRGRSGRERDAAVAGGDGRDHGVIGGAPPRPPSSHDDVAVHNLVISRHRPLPPATTPSRQSPSSSAELADRRGHVTRIVRKPPPPPPPPHPPVVPPPSS
jgi:hypothetical protein